MIRRDRDTSPRRFFLDLDWLLEALIVADDDDNDDDEDDVCLCV